MSKAKYYLLPTNCAQAATDAGLAQKTEYNEETVYDHAEWSEIEEYEGIFPKDREKYKIRPYRVAGNEPVVAVLSSLEKDDLYEKIRCFMMEHREAYRKPDWD